MTIDTNPADLLDALHEAVVPYERALDLIGDAYNAGTHGIGYSQQAMELHAAILAATPAIRTPV